MICLIISIITITKINQIGVPWGVKWAIFRWKKKTSWMRIVLNQREKPKEKVKIIWAVGVNKKVQSLKRLIAEKTKNTTINPPKRPEYSNGIVGNKDLMKLVAFFLGTVKVFFIKIMGVLKNNKREATIIKSKIKRNLSKERKGLVIELYNLQNENLAFFFKLKVLSKLQYFLGSCFSQSMESLFINYSCVKLALELLESQIKDLSLLLPFRALALLKYYINIFIYYYVILSYKGFNNE